MATIGAIPTPSNKKALQRLHGMITYIAKFLPNPSDVTDPLRCLLDKDVSNGTETIHKRNHESNSIESVVNNGSSVKVFRPQ